MALTDNLISYWSLEETSGTRVDAHSTNDLTDNNTVTSATGKIGTAASFVAANSEYLSIADNAALSTGDIDFTIACWVYFDSLSWYEWVVSKDNGGSREYGIYYDPFDQRLKMYVFSGGSITEEKADVLGLPSVSTWYFVVGWHDATNNTLNIQVNDGTVDSASYSAGVNDASAPFTVGTGTGGLYMDGRVDELGVWKRVLTAGERTELYNSGSGRDYAYISGAGGPTYTLTGDAGAYTVTGQAASLLAARKLTTDAGSYAVTGRAASLLAGRKLLTDAGAYSVSGQDASLLASRLLATDAGSYAVSGQDPSLLVSRLLSADAGSYATTGQSATLLASRLLAAEAGVYTLTGRDATLVYTPLGGATYTLAADAGSYTLSGAAVSLIVSRLLSADAGAYSVSGQDAQLLFGRLLTADAGSYTVTGQAATLLVSRLLATNAGSYTVSGKTVTLVYSGAVVPVTPADRVYIVPGEDRVFVILAEDRTFAVEAEDRTLVVH